MLELRLFGTGQARYDDRLLGGFPQQQCYLLFCYLLLNRHHTHHRDRVAAVFWGDCSSCAARKYLRNELWRLQHSLRQAGIPAQDYLLISEDSLSLCTQGSHWLDVEVFETTVTHSLGIPLDEWTADQVHPLQDAVNLYTGDLLEGIDTDWCLIERERFSLMHLNALAKLMAVHERNGDYELGLACGEQMLARDDTREKVHRQMMRLYWRMGDRDGVLEQYRRCEQILRETLGVAPVDETRFLYEEILAHQSPQPLRFSSRPAAPELPGRLVEDNESSLQQVLQRIHHLQQIMDETSAELSQLEQLAKTAWRKPAQ
jgi:DNA-binding SARP family transcriptional activator